MTRCLRVMFAVLVLTCLLVQGRAGDGDNYVPHGSDESGSFSDGDSGGDGDIGLAINLFMALPFPLPVKLAIIVLLLVGLSFARKKRAAMALSREFKATLDPTLQSDLRQGGAQASPPTAALEANLPGLFVAVQKAWDKGDMGPVRAVISDGVYHRFQIQLDMNSLQAIRNSVENPRLVDSRLLRKERFGNYLSADFLIRGEAVDSKIRLDTGAKAGGGSKSEFAEIWSFTRLADAPEGEALRALENCPKCAAPLSDAGGMRCGHCGAVLNSGAWDWVLAEITQAVEWAGGHDRSDLNRRYAALPETIGASAEDWLSPQELEDRASVVFIRYQRALHRGGLAVLAAFADPELIKSLSGPRREEPLFKLAVGSADLRGFAAAEGEVRAWVKVKFSGADSREAQASHRERVLVFAKSVEAQAGKGGLSSLSCASCGGPIEASDQAVCAYCGAALAGPAVNWTLIDYGGLDLMSQMPEPAPPLPALARPASASLAASASAASAAPAQIRILTAMAISALEDLAITPAEERTIRDFARHFGLGPIFVDMLLNKARQDPASLREQVDPKEAQRWLNNFLMVAASDGRISPEEEAMLSSFARRNGIEDKKVRFAFKAALQPAAG